MKTKKPAAPLFDTSFLANLTPEQFRAVWEALEQHADNHDLEDDGSEHPTAEISRALAERMAAAHVAATVGA